MIRTITTFAAAIVLCIAAFAGEVTIGDVTTPAGPLPLIQGKASKAGDQVVPFVKPVKLGRWWAQAPIRADGKRNWTTSIHLGDSMTPSQDGLEYDIVVLVNPKEPVSEGAVYTRLPEAEALSRVIRTKR